mgnify:CR=1 FL=1
MKSAWRQGGLEKIADIEHKQIIRLVEKLAKEPPIQTNRKPATLKKLFNYAVDAGAINGTKG